MAEGFNQRQRQLEELKRLQQNRKVPQISPARFDNSPSYSGGILKQLAGAVIAPMAGTAVDYAFGDKQKGVEFEWGSDMSGAEQNKVREGWSDYTPAQQSALSSEFGITTTERDLGLGEALMSNVDPKSWLEGVKWFNDGGIVKAYNNGGAVSQTASPAPMGESGLPQDLEKLAAAFESGQLSVDQFAQALMAMGIPPEIIKDILDTLGPSAVPTEVPPMPTGIPQM